MFENVKWIAKNVWTNWKIPVPDKMPPAPYIARTFCVKELPVKATLNICGLGQGAYYLNGKRIPAGSYSFHR